MSLWEHVDMHARTHILGCSVRWGRRMTAEDEGGRGREEERSSMQRQAREAGSTIARNNITRVQQRQLARDTTEAASSGWGDLAPPSAHAVHESICVRMVEKHMKQGNI
ncbi:unnamed protein product [Prorocentrum cordatum]|uniref:Uncharacterized protein n=1 Tax=Prorocentrum cordatum TaxID=2364126 RepID=A0ABN9W070_9DINO|nr:unnamed protein product [Polarella glacialis]